MNRFLVTFLVLLMTVPNSSAFAFRDDFNALDTNIWDVYANGGNVSVSSGRLMVSTTGSSHTAFPYLRNRNNLFPVSGDFCLKLGMRFTSFGPYGTGVITNTWSRRNGIPNGSQDDWADAVGIGADSSHQQWGTAYHDYEWRYSGGQANCYRDGVFLQLTQVGRPVSIEIGNPTTVPGGFTWTSFEVDYIEVVPTSVPEPSSILAILTGIAGTGGITIRKRK